MSDVLPRIREALDLPDNASDTLILDTLLWFTEQGGWCPACGGSGEVERPSDNGPDPQMIMERCDRCKGEQSLRAAYNGLKAEKLAVLEEYRRREVVWHHELQNPLRDALGLETFVTRANVVTAASRAFAMVDRSMYDDLRSYGVWRDGRCYVDLGQYADDFVKPAVEWLRMRGLVEGDEAESGYYVRIVRDPYDAGSAVTRGVKTIDGGQHG